MNKSARRLHIAADPADVAEAAVAAAIDGTPGDVRRLPGAPKYLSPEGRAWWRGIVAAFDVPAHHLGNLAGAALALDRATECRAILAAEGVVTVDRFGQSKEHPAAVAERGYLALHARLLREAGLDLQATPVPRAPTRWRSS